MGYKDYKERNICPTCGQSVEKGFVRCSSCRARANNKQTKLVHLRLMNRLCQECGRANDRYPKVLCSSCQEKTSIRWKKRHTEVKNEVLEHYGRKCICCGETEKDFLTIDHINNDGQQHRLEVGHLIYEWLKRSNYPKENYQVLCMNCNWAKALYKECPHKRSNVAEYGGTPRKK